MRPRTRGPDRGDRPVRGAARRCAPPDLRGHVLAVREGSGGGDGNVGIDPRRADAVAAALEQWIAVRDGGVGARIEVLDSLSASKDPTVAKAARERLRLEKRK